MFRTIALLGVITGATTALAAAEARPAAAGFDDPARQIEFFNLRHLSQTKRLVLPTLYVRVMQRRRDETTTPAVEITAPITVETARAVAAALYANLAEELRAAGWEVITHDAIKDRPGFTDLRPAAIDRQARVPVEEADKDKLATRHLVVAPEGMPVIQAGATGPIWAMKDLLRELDAGAMLLTCTFDIVPALADAPVAPPASGDEASAAAEAVPPYVPALQLTGINAEFYGVALASGWMRAREPQVFSDAIGTFDGNDERARGFPGLRGRRRLELGFQPTESALREAMIAAGRAFTASCARTIATYAPPKS